ncbi:MAG: rod shape-determining protein MreC [Candidatus Zixiibacteriota bacterium]
MNWFTNLFAKHWRSFHFTIIIVLSIILITKPDYIVPTCNQIVFSIFYSPFARIKNIVMEFNDVASDNVKLRKKLVEASVKISILEEASRENRRLRSILGFEQSPEYKLIPAEVVSIAGDYWPESAVINKGSDDSVMIDQAVINQQGLIGRVTSVSEDYATVSLLTNTSNSVTARIAESREMGIIKYTVSKGMILDHFPVQGKIQVGDLILSSGLGKIYPAGLEIGTVKEVIRPEHEPLCKVKVEPTANFYSIDELFILKEECK